jgi:hypothetical protein
MHPLTRREALAALAASSAAGLAPAAAPPVIELCPFSADVTVPLGHPLMGGGVAPAKMIDDPLFAHGFVLRGGGDPFVVVVVDWCEIRNDAYSRWREALAKAAGTKAERVLVSCIHQHDAPIADLEAERILREAKAAGSVCDPEFHEKAVQRVAKALRQSLKSPKRITHVGTGQAKVEKVASNRRYVNKDDRVVFDRMSATRGNVFARQAPENLIDPYLKTLSFWSGETPVLALSAYAVHPMSYYGKGGVSADFVGMARKRQQAALKDVAVIYASGASGNVVAGKYNDGDPANRPVLADRIFRAMKSAWKATKRTPITRLGFRSIPYRLEPRAGAFTVENLKKRLKEDKRPFGQCLAALGLSWRKRADGGHKLDLPVIDFGAAQLLLLPGESYVEFQLAAQKARETSFVMALGYGESATGYVPTEKAIKEKDNNLDDWCWVAPGAEKALTEAIRKALAE